VTQRKLKARLLLARQTARTQELSALYPRMGHKREGGNAWVHVGPKANRGDIEDA